MRIVLLTVSRLQGRGGKEAAMTMVSAELAARGHQVEVALVGPPIEREWERGLPGLRIGTLPDTWSVARRHPLATYRFLKALLRDRRPDVVVVTEPGGVVLLRAACRLGRLPMPKLVSWVHGDPRRMSYFQALRRCDAHLAISRGVADQIRSVARADAPVSVVYTPIAPARQIVRRPPGGAPAVFVFVGRVEPQKRVDRMLQMLARLPERRWRLEMIGDGALRPGLQQLASDLGIDDRVTWHGWQPEPWSCVGEATAFLMTSDTEGFPLVLLEAAGRGVPVVAMDCPFGPSEVIEEGLNGWLVPLGREDRFVEVLAGLCRGSLALPALADVAATVDRFRPDAVVQLMERTLAGVATVRGGS